jgi:uncharacterized protein
MRQRACLLLLAGAIGAVAAGCGWRPAETDRQPIVDVHIHAWAADAFGPPPAAGWPGECGFAGWDPQRPFAPAMTDATSACDGRVFSPKTDQEMLRQTLDTMARYRIVRAVASGPRIHEWKAAAPTAFIAGFAVEGQLDTDAEALRVRLTAGGYKAIAEMMPQYSGLAPDDGRLDVYFEAGGKLDLPIGIHMGLGPPGAAYAGSPKYRMKLSNPLALEEVLVKHPNVRVYVMHAGWPMLNEMLGVLYSYPQVYVDIGVIDWTVPRAEFHAYLRRLVEAGFGKRIMFGSDQMLWPQAIGWAVENVEAVPFLTAEQKRDIFYNNAVRFFRLQGAK